MTGAAPMQPPMSALRVLLAGGRNLAGPWGAVLEVCILTLCLPWEALAMNLERIDWDRAFVPVPTRRSGDGAGVRRIERVVPLSPVARAAIRRIAGDAGGRGQVVTAGRGRPLAAKLFRMDRLLDKLAEADPATIALPDWNMHGIRLAGSIALRDDGASGGELAAMLGRDDGTRPVRGLRGDLPQGIACAERWSRLLLAEKT